MTRHVVVRSEAAGDIEDAYNWYQRAKTGLGDEFLAAVRERIGFSRSPNFLKRNIIGEAAK